jgi:DivIVA domain-containing protein
MAVGGGFPVFRRVPLGRRGYDIVQVDAFVRAVVGTLASGGVPALVSANDIRRVTFALAPLGGRGYDPHDVDVYLDNVERVIATRDAADRAGRLPDPVPVPLDPAEVGAFRARIAGGLERTRFTRGYSVAAVEEFLAVLDADLATSGWFPPDEIRDAAFPTTPRGYVTGPVDELLDAIELALRKVRRRDGTVERSDDGSAGR